ncbi:MAG: hypothetical protein LBR33_12345 [Propionibacteriaceae bacterium]|jgi:ABC-2 type transport system permease protein|nr:hypothetical protein [Propionibacteriaceae bacterium]
MVATLLQLKVKLTQSFLKRSTLRLVLWILGVLYAGLMALIAVVALAAARGAVAAHPDNARVVTVLVGSLLVIAWTLVPTLFFGADQTLDPARFVLFPVTGRTLVVGLTLAGLVGVPGGLTVVIAVGGSLAAYSAAVGPALLAAAGAAAGAVLCQLCCRLPVTALSTKLTSRRGRDVMSLLAVVLFVVGYSLYILFGTGASEVSGSAFERLAARAAGVAEVLEWTPFGVAWTWGPDAAAGAWGLLAGHVVVTLAYVALGLWAFARLLDRALEAPLTTTGPAAVTADDAVARWSSRLPRLSRPTAAVAARSWLYYRRDPRYTAMLPLMLMFPVVFTIIGLSGAMPPDDAGIDFGRIVVMGGCAMLPFMAGVSLSNDIGSDSTAWWVHLAAAVRGRADRLGRMLAQAGWCGPLIIVAGIVIPTLVGAADRAPAAVGTMLGIYGASLGVASVFSGLIVYPIALPGESAMSMKTGDFGIQMLSQFGTMLGVCVVGAPITVAGLLLPVSLGWLVIVLGLVWGAAMATIGVVAGGKIVDQRGSAILATLRKNDTRLRA